MILWSGKECLSLWRNEGNQDLWLLVRIRAKLPLTDAPEQHVDTCSLSFPHLLSPGITHFSVTWFDLGNKTEPNKSVLLIKELIKLPRIYKDRPMLPGEQQKVPMLSSENLLDRVVDCQPITALECQQEKHRQAHGDVDMAGGWWTSWGVVPAQERFLGNWFSPSRYNSIPGGLAKAQSTWGHPRVSGSVGLRWGP